MRLNAINDSKKKKKKKGKEVWDIARVCRNPFGNGERCGILGRTYETGEEKLRAFVTRNLITEPAVERQRPVGQGR